MYMYVMVGVTTILVVPLDKPQHRD